MKMSLGQTLSVLPSLRQEKSSIPKITDPCLCDFPNKKYVWLGIRPGQYVATLDLRAWRVNGTLGCYFRTDDGRTFQLSGTWDVATSGWGANDAEVDFSSEEVRLGDRFILNLEKDPEARSARWISARRESASPSLRNLVPWDELLGRVGQIAGQTRPANRPATMPAPAAPVERPRSTHADLANDETVTDSTPAWPAPRAVPAGQLDTHAGPAARAADTHARPSSVAPIVVALGITVASAASLVMRRLVSAR